MRLNLKEIKEMKDGDFPLLPVGWYQARVSNTTFVDKEGKSPYVKTEFTIMEGEHKARVLFHNFIWTFNAAGFMKPFLLAIGYPESEVDIEYQEWEKKQLMIYVDTDSFTNSKGIKKDTNRVTMYKSLESEGKDPIHTEEDEVPF